MTRATLAALGGLGLLGAGAIALLLSAAPEKPVRPEPRPEAAVEPASPPVPQATGAQPSALQATAATAVRPAEAMVEVGAYPKDPTALLRALQPLQREVAEGLASLDSAGRCPLRGTFVQLTLETGDGEVLVREAVVKRPAAQPDEPPADHDAAAGAAEAVTDDALIRCVQQSMQGRALRAQSARPGRRWQTSYWQPAHPP